MKCWAACWRARPGRRVILTQQGNFPTDTYVAEGLAEMLGLELRRAPPEGIIGAIDDQTAVVTVTHVDYRSGARFDMRAVNEAARRLGPVAQRRSDRARPQRKRL